MATAITPAQKRALAKAVANGFIMRPGGFSPDNPLPGEDAREAANFDSGFIIERLIGAGLLRHGEDANQFVPTQAGIDLNSSLKAPKVKRTA